MMPKATPIQVLHLVVEGHADEAVALADALREESAADASDRSAGAETVTATLTASLLDAIAAMTAGDEAAPAKALACAEEARGAGRPAWAAAARAVAAGMALEAGHSADALAMAALAEVDLADELALGEPLDPPGGPTGPGAAANNLGAIYTELGLYSRAETHLREAARASTEDYGPDFRDQACIDERNLLAHHFIWAIELDADGDEQAAQEQARRGLAVAPGVIIRAREQDWPTIVDVSRIVELGCLSIAAPHRLPVTARHEVRAIIDTSPEDGPLWAPLPLLVLARLCRLAGDASGAARAAHLAAQSSYGPGDVCLAAALREAMLAAVPSESPAIDYGHALRGRLRHHRADLEAALDHRIAMVQLERTHADVRHARERLEQALDEAGEQEARLQEAAAHDPLTGLLNRSALQSRLARALAAAEESGDALAVAFIDLDGFKQVNDRRGHVVGDRFLAAVAAGLRRAVRENDTLARYGGDEFICLRESLRASDDLEQWAARLRQAVEEVAVDIDADIPVTASIGLCVVTDGARTPTEVIARADAAMYEAKRQGPGRVRVVA
jgi:diguanylate cyclase (GGDEF)-like protein